MLLVRRLGAERPRWTLPGGGLNFGEQPQVGALRELAEETGYVGEIEALLGVNVDHFIGSNGVDWHAVRIIYRAGVIGGGLTYERDGTSELAAWLSSDELASLDAAPLVAAARAASTLPGKRVESQPVERVPALVSALPRAARVAAYALLRDADQRVLLVHAGPRTTWAGRWILPGGGADHGEDLAVTIRRELLEETGLAVAVGSIRSVTSDVVDSLPRQQHLWTVRCVYDATVVGGTLRPEIDGSSDGVRWFDRDELDRTPLVPFVGDVLNARER